MEISFVFCFNVSIEVISMDIYVGGLVVVICGVFDVMEM